jgi:hypothetical protein
MRTRAPSPSKTSPRLTLTREGESESERDLPLFDGRRRLFPDVILPVRQKDIRQCLWYHHTLLS